MKVNTDWQGDWFRINGVQVARVMVVPDTAPQRFMGELFNEHLYSSRNYGWKNRRSAKQAIVRRFVVARNGRTRQS